MSEHFIDRLIDAGRARGTFAVVGLDPVLSRLPAAIRPAGDPPQLADAVNAVRAFGRAVIDRCAAHVPAVKINIAFFEALYAAGVDLYHEMAEYAHRAGLLVIGDIKRGDIGSTARLYGQAHLAAPAVDDVSAARIPDAVTLAGYLGENAVTPFIDIATREGKGVFVLVRPSDPGADQVHEFPNEAPGKFYQHMADLVARWGSAAACIGSAGYSCVGAVIAAKDIESTRALRARMPKAWFLVPGYGAQGGTAERCAACFNPDGLGAIVNASRSVIYAFDNDRYSAEHGDDWQACIEASCRDFAADIARIRDMKRE
jgi:orotidine-5'-phosphate decarboxylase